LTYIIAARRDVDKARAMTSIAETGNQEHAFNALPASVFRYVLVTSWPHQLMLVLLSAVGFLLEVVPLELQRRAVNDLAKGRAFRWIILIAAVYVAVVLVQGGTKLALNIYRGWGGERANRDLRQRIQSSLGSPSPATPEAEA
jgi:ABC-type multidrug transport system fused ATPase/permease subunit